MTNYLEKFKDLVEKKGYTALGQRHNHIPAVVSLAKFFEIEKSDLYEFASNYFGSEFKKEEKSFDDAWKKITPQYTISEKEAERNLEINDEEDVTTFPEFNRKFLTWIKNAKVEKMNFEDRDTSMLKYFFKDGDLIHIVSNVFDKCENAYDCRLLKEKEMPMKKFTHFSLATFKEFDGLRKQSNIKEIRYILLECDSLPLVLQEKMFFSMIEYGIPVKSITYSGGKSYHCLVKIHPIKNVEEYKEYAKNVIEELNKLFTKKTEKRILQLVDPANVDGIRYTRTPFGFRADKGKTQELIWCDMKEADDERYEFTDTLEQIKEYVKMFDSKAFNQQAMKHKPIVDANGILKYHLLDSLNSKEFEDIFLSNGKYWLKMRDKELQSFGKSEIWDIVNNSIDKDIINLILEGKDEKHKKVTMNDFYVCVKDIKFEVTLKDNENFYNIFKPGFITECVERECKEIPSEFDKLLDNIADSKCKEWLLNHLACHFWLIQNGFKLNGNDFVLETVPVFYGMSGTGKNTFLDVIGQAISSMGTRYISIGNIADDFNEYYMAGAVNVNEAAKGKAERRASKEALKKFTDKYQSINMKFMPKIRALNTAYKSISANESIYGVLDIDEFDRRFQYITGGNQLNAMQNNVCNMRLLNEQRKDFIAYLLNRECDFDKAQICFDNEAKKEDKIQSLSSLEQVALWIKENIDEYPYEAFSIQTVVSWYAEKNCGGKIPEVNRRLLGKLLTRYFGNSKFAGRSYGNGIFMVNRGERCYFKEVQGYPEI